MGEMTWEIEESYPEEMVAETHVTKPYLAFGRLAAFNNLRYPHFAPNGDVAFIADDPVKFLGESGSNTFHGIYLSKEGESQLTVLAEIDKPVTPDQKYKPTYISALQTDLSRYVFFANYGEKELGTFLWEEGKGTRLIAGSTSEGPWDFFTAGYAAISGDLVVFAARTRSGSKGLYLHQISSGTTKLLIEAGTPIPGREYENLHFQYFSGQPWIDGDTIIFRADSSTETAKTTRPHPDDLGIGGSRGIYGWEGIDFSNPQTWAPERLITFVDGTTPVPYGEGERFCYLGSAPVRDGRIAFHGGWFGRHGIYTIKGNELLLIADTHTEIPGLFEGPFTGFDKWVSVMPDMVAFRGMARNGYEGIFLYQAQTDTLVRLFDNRETIEGKSIRSFEISGHMIVEDRFAAMVRFTDGSSKICLFRMPEMHFSRSASKKN